MVAGGDFGGEYSGRSAQPVIAVAGLPNSKAANHRTVTTTGWNTTVFVSSALSWTLAGVFWQQPCDAGIPISPHWCFIVRQQARSSAFISALGAMQAIAGATQVARSSINAPNWRKKRIPL